MTSLRVPSVAVLSMLLVSVATSADAQSKPIVSNCAPLGSTVFPPDSGRVRAGDGAVFRSLVDTATTNLARLEMHVTSLAPGKPPHAPHRHPHAEHMIVRWR